MTDTDFALAASRFAGMTVKTIRLDDEFNQGLEIIFTDDSSVVITGHSQYSDMDTYIKMKWKK